MCDTTNPTPSARFVFVIMATVGHYDDRSVYPVESFTGETGEEDANHRCEVLTVESHRLAGKVEALADLMKDWTDHNPLVTGQGLWTDDDQAIYSAWSERERAERDRLTRIIFGEGVKAPWSDDEVPSYYVVKVPQGSR